MTEILPGFNWPTWHKGKELRSADLHGLEDYLLSPTKWFLRPGYGVDQLGPDSIFLEVGSESRIHVRLLRGITSGGHPIVLSSPQRTLAVGISDPDERYDVYVAVGLGKEPTAESEAALEPGKLSVMVQENAGHSQVDEHEVDRLFLGTVAFSEEKDGQRRASWDRLPFVRRIDAIYDLDRWSDWVLPLSSQLGELLRGPRPSKLASDVQAAYQSQLFHLAFHWRTLPIPTFVGAIGYLQWLLDDGPSKWSPKQEIASWYEPDLRSWPGEDVPKRLAKQLETLRPAAEHGESLIPGEDYERQFTKDGRLTIKLTPPGIRKLSAYEGQVWLEVELKSPADLLLMSRPNRRVPANATRVPNTPMFRFPRKVLELQEGVAHTLHGAEFKEREAPELRVMTYHDSD